MTESVGAHDGISAYHEVNFERIGVQATWRKFGERLNWGRGQCLALLDDGCDLSDPPWQVIMPWGPKVVACYNSIENNADPTPVLPGYHGTSVGYPSSLYHDNIAGIAYNNAVAQVRCVTVVHLDGQGEAPTMARALNWVLAHHERYNITAVNLSPLDDERHQNPVPTPVDSALKALRERGIWVSAPCGNHGYTDGISWPACQPHCFGIGATSMVEQVAGDSNSSASIVHLDRFSNTDLLVAGDATSSSNACAAACAIILREAIETADYPWSNHAENMADAIMDIFLRTGGVVEDAETGLAFRELNLLAAVSSVLHH